MDSNGKFVKSVAMEHSKMYTNDDADKMKIATEVIDACKDIDVSADHCEAAAVYCKCLHDQSVAHGVSDLNF